jgi:hypothetical protein
MIQQMNRNRRRQALEVKTSVGLAGLHFRLYGPAYMLQTRVANLKPVDDFDAVRVESGLVREVPEQA